jgi:hypothetical protein
VGCWNGTCALTNLPILHGDDVLLILIQQGKHWDPNQPTESPCYNTTFWEPVGLPITAKYNDYGWIEDVVPSPMTDLLLAEINNRAVAREIGKNQYHDHAVEPGTIDIENLGELLHGDRLQFRGYERNCSVAGMMIRKDVVDEMIRRYSFERWSSDGVITLQKRIDKIRGYIADYLGAIMKIADDDHADIRHLLARSRIERETKTNFPMMQNFFDLCEKGLPNADVITAFVAEAARADWISIILSHARKHYGPTTGSGSQDSNLEVHEALMASMTSAIRTMRDRYGDDEFEDEIEDEDLDTAGCA